MAKKRPEHRSLTRKTEADLLPKGYEAFLGELKERIRTAQVQAATAVNLVLIELYWHIGASISERQKTQGWGNSVVERLARDLKTEFPGMSGFSPRNVWRMRAFYLAYTEEVGKLPQPVAEMDGENLPRAVAEIAWGHNSDLLDKVKDPIARLWYAHKTVENGWSRNVLVHWIESGLYERQGKAQTNSQRTLPKPQSDLARETLKDPYKKPVGVASYITKLVESLPPEFRGSLPSPEEWQAELKGKTLGEEG